MNEKEAHQLMDEVKADREALRVKVHRLRELALLLAVEPASPAWGVALRDLLYLVTEDGLAEL